MPFGDSVQIGEPAQHPPQLINFKRVYEDLLKPALRLAGCTPFRADAEPAAGDIRTDMFFELVTADIVVADISASNANVFYELGVRDGVCRRGVFLVRGNWSGARPFDIAPDRDFSYEGKYFEAGKETTPPHAEVLRVAEALKRAIRADAQTTASPVYSHLQGLTAPVWDDIQTSRARYFGALRDDWLERVRIAEKKGRPGHILTLAGDAPTRMHRTQILFEAAKALIGLCRYTTAEQVLRELLSDVPDDEQARLQLGVVLEQQNRAGEAEDEIRSMLRKREDDAPANRMLGHVYRNLWRLTWKCRPNNAQENRQLAIDNYSLAASAFRSFWRAQELAQAHETYFSRFNAVWLLAIIDDLFVKAGRPRPPDFGLDSVADLIPVVRFDAQCARRLAMQCGDHDEQFWSTTTLSGMALLEGQNHEEEALQLIRDACIYPQTTMFQLVTLRHRLELLQELDFKSGFAAHAIKIVGEATASTETSIGKVVLFYGRGVDKSNKSKFLYSTIAAVQQEIENHLTAWEIGAGDLAICGDVHESDILFAEACQKRGAHVRFLIRQLHPEQLESDIWPFESSSWAGRFQKLASGGAHIWVHEEELGPPLESSLARGRHNRWILNTALMEAEAAKEEEFYGLVLWNSVGVRVDLDDPRYYESPGYLVASIRAFRRYRGVAEVIDPSKFEGPCRGSVSGTPA
jgi:hypothetical protein